MNNERIIDIEATSRDDDKMTEAAIVHDTASVVQTKNVRVRTGIQAGSDDAGRNHKYIRIGRRHVLNPHYHP